MTKKKLTYTPILLEQRSEEWLDWRKGGIGASESSILMGSLPFEYEDILELYKKKVGLPIQDFIMTEAIQHGIDMEDEALEKFCAVVGKQLSPKCFTHPEYSYIRASMDGVDDELTMGVEIKCPSTTKFYSAKKGIVLDYYYTQMQHQMACTGLEELHYWVYRQKDGGVLMKVKRNDEYIAELVRRAGIFWEAVQNEEPLSSIRMGMDVTKVSDPYRAGDMSTEFIGYYKN